MNGAKAIFPLRHLFKVLPEDKQMIGLLYSFLTCWSLSVCVCVCGKVSLPSGDRRQPETKLVAGEMFLKWFDKAREKIKHYTFLKTTRMLGLFIFNPT